jgi:serine/threonine protein kinase
LFSEEVFASLLLFVSYASQRFCIVKVIWWHFFQIASAVEHIHKQGVLHREITPANIFLTKSGLCKLGDFGLGLIMKERKDMAISNVRTCSYMAPELHLGGQ